MGLISRVSSRTYRGSRCSPLTLQIARKKWLLSIKISVKASTTTSARASLVAKVGGFQTKLSKMKYNIASQVMTCSHKFKINDSCDANVATSLHLPTFGDIKIGAQLHFGV